MTAVLAPTTTTGLRVKTSLRIGDKPLLRGRLHQVCAFASIPAGTHMVGEATPGAGQVTAAVFALSWTLMFATSATYHRVPRTEFARFWMRRADHSMIFVHMAGGMTPLLVLGLSGRQAVVAVAGTWLAAGVGIAIKLTRLTNERCSGSWLYPLLAWTPAALLPLLASTLGTTGIVLLLSGGVVYTAGAVCFFYKWPDPIPTVFGFHEVWHVFTLVGGIFQYALTLRLVGAV